MCGVCYADLMLSVVRCGASSSSNESARVGGFRRRGRIKWFLVPEPNGPANVYSYTSLRSFLLTRPAPLEFNETARMYDVRGTRCINNSEY
jgi:hypothetical protein